MRTYIPQPSSCARFLIPNSPSCNRFQPHRIYLNDRIADRPSRYSRTVHSDTQCIVIISPCSDVPSVPRGLQRYRSEFAKLVGKGRHIECCNCADEFCENTHATSLVTRRNSAGVEGKGVAGAVAVAYELLEALEGAGYGVWLLAIEMVFPNIRITMLDREKPGLRSRNLEADER